MFEGPSPPIFHGFGHFTAEAHRNGPASAPHNFYAQSDPGRRHAIILSGANAESGSVHQGSFPIMVLF
jgi:hypothetical protein